MSATFMPLWPTLEKPVMAKQPPDYRPRINASGWLILHSPLRDDDVHPSFAIKPDTEDEAGGFVDYATGQKGSIAELARLLGVDPKVSSNGASATGVKPRPRVVATYTYRDADGRLLYEAVRYEPKAFRQRRPDGHGGWAWSLDGAALVLYRLPELLAADPLQPVIVVEGEKDADRLAGLGLMATTCPMGAGKWRDQYGAVLRGRHVAIIPDNDQPGREHATKVATSLCSKAASVKVIDLAGLPEHGDVSDWLDAGGTIEDLQQRMHQAQAWTPPASTTSTPEPAAEAMRSEPGPPDLDEAALIGLSGRIVKAIEPHTEAHPAALLLNTLVFFGNAVGWAPHAVADGARHGTNLFAVIVGKSRGGRKGTATAQIQALYTKVDPIWAGRIKHGLSSGEGLIAQVRDPVTRTGKDGEEYVVDEGEMDKRLMVIESEFGAVLKVITREGNTLGTLVRCAWDGGTLATLTKNPTTATNAHISTLAHITPFELRQLLTQTDASNGFGNRYLWALVHRAKSLPNGGGTVNCGPLVTELHDAIEFARACTQPIQRDKDADHLWAALYDGLIADKPGLAAEVTSRGEAQVLRLSVVYALMDKSKVVTTKHLLAALAVWEFCERSAFRIFSDATGSRDADRTLEALKQRPEGLDREDIYNLFNKNVSATRRDAALVLLEHAHLITCTTEATEGRNRTVYRAVSRHGGAH